MLQLTVPVNLDDGSVVAALREPRPACPVNRIASLSLTKQVSPVLLHSFLSSVQSIPVFSI